MRAVRHFVMFVLIPVGLFFAVVTVSLVVHHDFFAALIALLSTSGLLLPAWLVRPKPRARAGHRLAWRQRTQQPPPESSTQPRSTPSYEPTIRPVPASTMPSEPPAPPVSFEVPPRWHEPLREAAADVGPRGWTRGPWGPEYGPQDAVDDRQDSLDPLRRREPGAS